MAERRHGIGRAAGTGLLLLGGIYLLALLWAAGEGDRDPLPQATLPAVLPSVERGRDQETVIRLLRKDGTVEATTLRDYLWGVTAAEMPASFGLEALKAQAVCARTYCLYQRRGDKHPEADVCTDHTCCQAYLTREQAAVNWGEQAQVWGEKVAAAVEETDGLCVLYGGEVIDAVFFSSSPGRTSDAVAVWGTDVPYLRGVDSPEGEEVPGWRTAVQFSPQEFAQRMEEAGLPCDFSGQPEGWIQITDADPSGVVRQATVGGVTLTGGRLRSLLGLRSACFTVEGGEAGFTFLVTGYGHNVGLSQYGANALAGEGKDFREILTWYYTGAEVGFPSQ